MKKLLFILFLLPVLCFGQGRFPYSNTAHISSGGGSYTDEYQSLLDEWTTDPTGDTLTWQNALVDSLVTRGYWERMDLLYVMANNNEANSLIMWLDPSDGTYDLTEGGVGSLTFTRNEGFTGDGDNTLNTNLDLNDATNYTLNDATVSVYVRNNTQQTYPAVGSNDAVDYIKVAPYDGSGNFDVRINTTNHTYLANTDSRGMFTGTRRSVSNQEIYINGVSADTEVDNSTGIPESDLYLLGYGIGEDEASIYQVSVLFVMDAVSDAEIALINGYFETYMDNIGKGVQ